MFKYSVTRANETLKILCIICKAGSDVKRLNQEWQECITFSSTLVN